MNPEEHLEPNQWLNFAEGYAACVEAAFHDACCDLAACPYEEGSREEKCWSQGWKRAEEILS